MQNGLLYFTTNYGSRAGYCRKRRASVATSRSEKQGNVGAHRTVLVYIAGRNNLSRFATDDLREMLEGSKLIDDEQTLLVFMPRGWMNEEPWLARIKNGEVTDKVKLSEMEQLAQATDEVTDSIDGRLGDVWHDTTGLIHYNNLTEDGKEFHRECNIYYDAGDYIRRYATPEEYRKWKSVLDGAIVTKRYASTWHTDLKWEIFFTDFTMTPEGYHGISMFIDQDDSTKHGKIDL